MENSTKILEFLERAILNFEPPKPNQAALGTLLPSDWYKNRLEELKSALITPYELEVLIGESSKAEPLKAKALILAEEPGGDKLAYVPLSEKDDFVLVFSKNENENEHWTYEFLRDSNPVNCFLSF